MESSAGRVRAQVEQRGIRFVHLWFTDVLGFLKSFAVPSEELDGAFRDGAPFDGSAIEGFARIEEADMLARPDPSTFRVIESAGGEPVARMLCDITYPDGAPFDGDPRWVLRRCLERAAAEGFTLLAEPEVEFFVSASSERFEPLDRGGYFDLTPGDDGLRRGLLPALDRLGIAVQAIHHEDAPSQHEVDLPSAGALAVADDVISLRLAVKEVAQGLGIHASFMPKPAVGIQGSGMHTHFRLLEGERNALFDATAEAGLSKVGRAFVGGLLEHAVAITAVTNQWVNSYKRLVPGYEAPIHVCWSRRNRSALVRVPADRPDDERACRVEYRATDPACNPYLAFAVILSAGLDGILRQLEPPAEVVEDLQRLSADEVRAAGIRMLPDNLHDAVAEMERSELVAETLGEHLFEWFVRNKREEWELHRADVTPLEIERSFPLL